MKIAASMLAIVLVLTASAKADEDQVVALVISPTQVAEAIIERVVPDLRLEWRHRDHHTQFFLAVQNRKKRMIILAQWHGWKPQRLLINIAPATK